ncbi:MAG: 2-phosphosulfolactate phosphatase [Burkholderiales bacterium]|nr:2-phosphosulfolactate phosphatase [Burkholderiales bacterium]
MQIFRSDLPHCAELTGAVVVIDVLRSFTTSAVALAQGADEVIAVDSLEAAQALRQRDPNSLAIGALGGGAPAPGLDLGNSPSQLTGLDLRGRSCILYTAGGTRALNACGHADMVLAASLVCAGATAARLRALAPARVTLVVTGVWTDRDGDEDHACADLIEALLRGDDPPHAPFVARVHNSDFGRRFSAGDNPHLPPADLACCAGVDTFDFAMPISRRPGAMVIRRTHGPTSVL